MTEFEQLVGGRRSEVEARLTAIESRLAAIRSERSGANDDDEHDPDGATLSTEWSRAEGQRTDAMRELGELDAAQERVAAGSYGACAGCGRPFRSSAFGSFPAARLCVRCASRP